MVEGAIMLFTIAGERPRAMKGRPQVMVRLSCTLPHASIWRSANGVGRLAVFLFPYGDPVGDPMPFAACVCAVAVSLWLPLQVSFLR